MSKSTNKTHGLTLSELTGVAIHFRNALQRTKKVDFDMLSHNIETFLQAKYTVSSALATAINDYLTDYYHDADNSLETARKMVVMLDKIIKIGVTPTNKLYQMLEELTLQNKNNIESDDLTNILWIGTKSGNAYSEELIDFLNNNLLTEQYKAKNHYEKVNMLWSLSINRFMGLGCCKNNIIKRLSKSITHEEITRNFDKTLKHKLAIADFILRNEKRTNDVNVTDDIHTSYLQEYILNTILPKDHKYRELLQKEYTIKELGKSVDGIILKNPNDIKGALIIEVDGPHHYTNGPERLEILRPKDTFLRKLIEERFECKVLSISWNYTASSNWETTYRTLIENYIEQHIEATQSQVESIEKMELETSSEPKITPSTIETSIPNEEKEDPLVNLSIAEQLYKQAASTRHIENIPNTEAANILYNNNCNIQETLNLALLISTTKQDERTAQVLILWGADMNYVYEEEIRASNPETKLMDSIRKDEYEFAKYTLENHTISKQALQESFYFSLQSCNRQMTLLLHKHGACFMQKMDSGEDGNDCKLRPLIQIINSNNEKLIVFAHSILQSLIFNSDEITDFSNEDRVLDNRNIVILMLNISLCLKNKNNPTDKTANDLKKVGLQNILDLKDNIQEELSQNIYFWNSCRAFYMPSRVDYNMLLGTLINYNMDPTNLVTANNFALLIKHASFSKTLLNDDAFINSFTNFQQVIEVCALILAFKGNNKPYFTNKSAEIIVQKFARDSHISLILHLTEPPLHTELIDKIIYSLMEQSNYDELKNLLQYINIYNLDCAKLLIDIANRDNSSSDNIIRIYHWIYTLSQKLMEQTTEGSFCDDLSEADKSLIESKEYSSDIKRYSNKAAELSIKLFKKKWSTINKVMLTTQKHTNEKDHPNTSFSEKELNAVIQNYDIDDITYAINNNLLENSLFIDSLDPLESVVYLDHLEAAINFKNGTPHNIVDKIKNFIQKTKQEADTKAKTIYAEGFKNAINEGFYDGAKLISSKIHNDCLEFLETLHEIYESGDNLNVTNMLRACDFKFGTSKKDVVINLCVAKSKDFNEHSLDLTKWILDLGYTVTNSVQKMATTIASKCKDNESLQEATTLIINSYHEQPEQELTIPTIGECNET